ncbi:MAG: hypothetical protein P4L90_27015 [Rhodopila sp.]|nr:hypothetical protein [Rhodopila sp.]
MAFDGIDKQTTSRSSKFLDACRAINRGDLAEDWLAETTAKLAFNNVIDAFHMVGSGLVPVQFFIDERTAGGEPSIRLTDDLRNGATLRGGAQLSQDRRHRFAFSHLNLPFKRVSAAVSNVPVAFQPP